MSRKKWWEVVSSKEQNEVFNLIARHPKYPWRNIIQILKELGWSIDKLENILKPFLDNKIVLIKRDENGAYLGYWERVDNKKENKLILSDNDPNLI